MKTSESIKELAAALLKARPGMGRILKDSTAKIEGQKANYSYKYADLANTFEAVLPSLLEHGVLMIQSTDSSDPTIVTVQTRLYHAASGEWMESELSIKPTASDAKAIGSAITYARRYSIQPLLGLATEDDDGTQASKPVATGPAPSTPPSKINVATQARFNAFSDALSQEKREKIIREIQGMFGHEETGFVADLFSGEEVHAAYKAMERAAKENKPA